MRKKIFIIHGKGVNRGIGKEGGGDLDTVGSNALYAVWAQNSLREELGRDPVYGEDYEFDFLNYSEGIAGLAVHSGCDLYIPDFPIDALAPRMKLLVIDDEETIELINEYTTRLNDFKSWIIKNADSVSDEIKGIFNASYKQLPKVMEHQEKAALLTALEVLKITLCLTELDVARKSIEEPQIKYFLDSLIQGMTEVMTGKRLQELKKTLKEQFEDKTKEKMIDALVREEPLNKDAVLGFDKAISMDMSTNGRVNYSDELLIVATEVVAYVVRGMMQMRDLPFLEKPAASYKITLHHLTEELKRHFRKISNLCISLPEDAPDGVKKSVKGICGGTDSIVNILDHLGDYLPESRKEAARFTMRVMLVEEATAAAAPDVEIEIKKLKGEGKFEMPDGQTVDRAVVTVRTDERGAARVIYIPPSPDEDYLFSVTFDDLNFTILPAEVRPPDDVMELIFDEVQDELGESLYDEKVEEGPDRAMVVALATIERHFRLLKENDVHVASMDDHHPYTQEIFDLLHKMKEEGLIGNVQVASLPRGQELPVEKQKCGNDLIYADRIEGKPWDNPGLAELRRIAHIQDLHIGSEPLALELSKLIGSKFNKIEMARGLAEGIKDMESMRNIMQSTGWDNVVKVYEDGLEKVLPRTEQILGVMKFHKADDPGHTVHIMVGLSPFCDAKKGEVQINVASAINYLLGGKGYRADYLFYTYGSHLMTTRKPNEEETTLNLSTMCQHIGTKADGGHSGAATCKPSSNPAFPMDRLDKVRDTNFLEYLEYLAGKVVEYSGLVLDGVEEMKVEKYTGPVEKALRHVGENAFEMTLAKKDNPEETLKVLFTRAPKINRRAGDEKPSFLQVLNYLKRHSDADYLIFSQGMLYRFILCNMSDDKNRLDLPRLARAIGWDEDGGGAVLAVADIKKNRNVKKRLRRMLNPHMYHLIHLMERFIEEGSDYRVVSAGPLLIGSAEAAAGVLSRIDANTYVIDLASDGDAGGKGAKLRVVAALAPKFDRKKGEMEPTLSLVVDHLKDLKPNYLIYSDHIVPFPRKDQVMSLMRVDDDTASIDCSGAVSALAGKQFCGDDRVAEFMPGFVEGSPLGKTHISPQNYRQFLDFMLGKICGKTGYKVERIEKKGGVPAEGEGQA